MKRWQHKSGNKRLVLNRAGLKGIPVCRAGKGSQAKKQKEFRQECTGKSKKKALAGRNARGKTKVYGAASRRIFLHGKSHSNFEVFFTDQFQFRDKWKKRHSSFEALFRTTFPIPDMWISAGPPGLKGF